MNKLIVILVLMMMTFRLLCLAEDDENDEDLDDEDNGDDNTQSDDIGFTFGEDDETGPKFWKGPASSKNGNAKGRGFSDISPVEMKLYAKNHCDTNWRSPINIKTSRVTVPEFGGSGSDAERIAIAGYSPTITIVPGADIEKKLWEFGHPIHTYNGIEIRAVSNGMLELMDYFEPLGKSDLFTSFHFHFLSIFYCDLDKASGSRSMHQIDGEKFPLELHFVFLTSRSEVEQKEMLQDQSLDPEKRAELMEDNTVPVIVVVQGEIGRADNRFFEPVAEAARKFQGKAFDVKELDETNAVHIEVPWSPTWLLPDASDYYYYDDGSFPIPPCFKVFRYYILRERITISPTQLNALTSIRTAREKDGVLPCTFSKVQDDLLSGDVAQNLVEFELKGDDHKPRTRKETLAWRQRQAKMEIYKRTMQGRAVQNGAGTGAKCNFFFGVYLLIKIVYLIVH